MKLFYIMGRSASGKDTIFNRLINDSELDLDKIILYTTRPMRNGEQDGVQYYFVNNDTIEQLNKENKILECRTYDTALGPLSYCTVYDEQFTGSKNLLTIGTLVSFKSLKSKLKDIDIIPIFISLDNETLYERAVIREMKNINPNFEEIERRFQADLLDFSIDKLRDSGITEECTFYNYDLEETVKSVKEYINKFIK